MPRPSLRPALVLLLASTLVATATPAAEPGKPLYGSWGFDLAGADLAVRPGDNFFRYANGTWLDHATIAPDKSANTLRLQMTDRTEERIHAILETAATGVPREPATLEGKAGAFYASFMDEARVAKLGAAPLAADLAALRGARTRADLAALMGRSNVSFVPTIFGAWIDVDLKDPSRYAMYFSQSGLGLPDRDYYLEPGFAKVREAYEAYAATLLAQAGWPQPQARAKQILAFETRLAEASWTRVQQRDLNAIYNPLTIPELESLTPGIPWRRVLDAAGLAAVTRVIVAEKNAFPKLAAVYAQTPLETLRAWNAFRAADNAAPYLSQPFVDAHFGLHGRTLTGQQAPRARWKQAITAVSGDDFLVGERFGSFGTMGFGVGQLYTAKYFGPEARAKIEALVANLKAAYRVRLEHLDWMGPETRKEALRKLDTYTIKVGYPDHPRDYAALVVKSDDLVGNVLRAAALDWSFQTGRLFGPVDRSDWTMTPQTNDAYNGSLRDIVFPAGILQAPLFDENADPAVNYGAIGGIIGHELTHGFDDEGRKIDADGALRDWWTKEDAERFEKQAKMLADQYSAFEVLPGLFVNGQLTLGENIADLGGVASALDAYRASLGGAPAPVLDGFTGDQRVLLGWAQAWRGKVTDDFVRKQVVSDPHSPRRFRVIGPTRNLDPWYEAFGVRPTDAMYLAPERRVRIW